MQKNKCLPLKTPSLQPELRELHHRKHIHSTSKEIQILTDWRKCIFLISKLKKNFTSAHVIKYIMFYKTHYKIMSYSDINNFSKFLHWSIDLLTYTLFLLSKLVCFHSNTFLGICTKFHRSLSNITNSNIALQHIMVMITDALITLVFLMS